MCRKENDKYLQPTPKVGLKQNFIHYVLFEKCLKIWLLGLTSLEKGKNRGIILFPQKNLWIALEEPPTMGALPMHMTCGGPTLKSSNNY